MHQYFSVSIIHYVVVCLVQQVLLQLRVICKISVPAEAKPLPLSAMVPFKRLRQAFILASRCSISYMADALVACIPFEYFKRLLPVACLEHFIDRPEVFISIQYLHALLIECCDSCT